MTRTIFLPLVSLLTLLTLQLELDAHDRGPKPVTYTAIITGTGADSHDSVSRARLNSHAVAHVNLQNNLANFNLPRGHYIVNRQVTSNTYATADGGPFNYGPRYTVTCTITMTLTIEVDPFRWP